MIGRTCADRTALGQRPRQKDSGDRGREEQVKAEIPGSGRSARCVQLDGAPRRSRQVPRRGWPGRPRSGCCRVSPRSHFIRAASEACRIECCTNETTPSMPTRPGVTGFDRLGASGAQPDETQDKPDGPDHVSTTIAIGGPGIRRGPRRVCRSSPSWSVMVVAPCLRILIGGTELIYGLRSTSELVVGACRDRTCSCRWKIR